jgi:hypothetical protein
MKTIIVEYSIPSEKEEFKKENSEILSEYKVMYVRTGSSGIKIYTL